MDNFLDRMAASSRERAAALQAAESADALLKRARSAPEPLPLVLNGFDLIAELKLRSPAMGSLADQSFDPGPQLDAYVDGGAAAVSVLTEPAEFRGELAHLEMAAERLRPSGCPVMRKDFLVDASQVIEARAHGASGVLLIAAMLSDADLDEMIAAATELRLFVLLEAFDTDDLERLARVQLSADTSALIGVNSRDLKTLAVDFDRFEQLAGQLRKDLPAVAESGIHSIDAIETVAGLGYSLALIGSALMQDSDARATVAGFVAAGRKTVEGRALCS